VHPKGANSMAVPGLVHRNDLVGTGRAISIHFGHIWSWNKWSHHIRYPFPAFKSRIC